MSDNYVCSFCNACRVKLWQPFDDSEILLCAKCAEAIQSPRISPVYSWKKSENSYMADFVSKQILMPKWHVNKRGEIPSDLGIGPDGEPMSMVTMLTVNLSDLFYGYSESTPIFPAIKDSKGEPYFQSASYKTWRQLPTR